MSDPTPSDPPVVHPFVEINRYIVRATTHMIGSQIIMIDLIESACLPVSRQPDPRADEELSAALDSARDSIKKAQHAIRTYKP